MREASLEEFLDGSDGDPKPATGEESSEGSAGPDGNETTADGTIEPATVIYAWTPEGGACPACGTAIERRWRDGDRLVCADCKDW
jgi:hypothetical protein